MSARCRSRLGRRRFARHPVARRADGEIYFGHAERDRYAPPDVVERVDDALSGCRARVQSRVHPLAEHGYAMPDRNVFDQKATEQDWAAIFAMLGRQLSEGRA